MKQRGSTVDEQYGSRHVGGLGGAQERRRLGDLFGRAELTQRHDDRGTLPVAGIGLVLAPGRRVTGARRPPRGPACAICGHGWQGPSVAPCSPPRDRSWKRPRSACRRSSRSTARRRGQARRRVSPPVPQPRGLRGSGPGRAQRSCPAWQEARVRATRPRCSQGAATASIPFAGKRHAGCGQCRRHHRHRASKHRIGPA